jgi:hypothetical protein
VRAALVCAAGHRSDMNEQTARTVANLVLFTAGAAATYAVLTRPRLRRMVFRVARAWVGASVPYLVHEVRQAWAESGRVVSRRSDVA